MKSMNAEGLALLNGRYGQGLPANIRIALGHELCNQLSGIVRKAIEIGMPKTAQHLQDAVESSGYELAAILESKP